MSPDEAPERQMKQQGTGWSGPQEGLALGSPGHMQVGQQCSLSSCPVHIWPALFSPDPPVSPRIRVRQHPRGETFVAGCIT